MDLQNISDCKTNGYMCVCADLQGWPISCWLVWYGYQFSTWEKQVWRWMETFLSHIKSQRETIVFHWGLIHQVLFILVYFKKFKWCALLCVAQQGDTEDHYEFMNENQVPWFPSHLETCWTVTHRFSLETQCGNNKVFAKS